MNVLLEIEVSKEHHFSHYAHSTPLNKRGYRSNKAFFCDSILKFSYGLAPNITIYGTDPNGAKSRGFWDDFLKQEDNLF